MAKNTGAGDEVVSEEASMLAARLVRRLKTQGWTLATAESCTGGLLSSTFTDISGASEWFRQGWVTYSNESKAIDLGVPEEAIAKKGAVSHEVARLMAQGAAKAAGTEVAISTTGIAGPTGGTASKPVGTCYVGISLGDSYLVRKGEFGGADRASNKHSFVLFALQKALEAWDAHFERKAEFEAAQAEAEAAAAAGEEVPDLDEALVAMSGDLDAWRETRWSEEKTVSETVAESSRSNLADAVEWGDE